MTHLSKTSALDDAAIPASSGFPLCRSTAHASKASPGIVEQGRLPCCLSIDFEDFLHDFQRTLGVSLPRRSPASLVKAYDIIERFARTRLGGARLTFFTTGQVARDYPDIVRRIAADGHEIACHSYEHDQIWHQSRLEFRRSLELAIECLTRASGQTIRGFRAPDFSIDERCAHWVYEELSRYFSYDSSRVGTHHQGQPHSPEVLRFAKSELMEFAIFQRRLAPGFDVRVTGGTYMRFLPIGSILELLREASARGFLPQVYLHPYDILHEYEQWSRWSDLAQLRPASRIYWWIRQNQWHSIGNRSVMGKLERIFDEFTHPGPLVSLVPASPKPNSENRSQTCAAALIDENNQYGF